uniref:Uncharacterized protein n=1 Tax=Setaria viridis TaxID=4556 RepID=A0A4U6WEC4_SETVI|nr:hypothetical protein SEVIR_1G177720v2 [Setaria viridis]
MCSPQTTYTLHHIYPPLIGRRLTPDQGTRPLPPSLSSLASIHLPGFVYELLIDASPVARDWFPESYSILSRLVFHSFP